MKPRYNIFPEEICTLLGQHGVFDIVVRVNKAVSDDAVLALVWGDHVPGGPYTYSYYTVNTDSVGVYRLFDRDILDAPDQGNIDDVIDYALALYNLHA